MIVLITVACDGYDCDTEVEVEPLLSQPLRALLEREDWHEGDDGDHFCPDCYRGVDSSTGEVKFNRGPQQ